MNVFKLYFIALLVTCLTAANSCEKDKIGDDKLTTHNNSTDSIFSVIKIPEVDTDSLQSGTCVYCFVKIPPKTIYKHFNQIDWKTYIHDRNPNNRISVIIIAPDTLRKYSFSEIVDLENYLARYDLTVNQLDTMNWIVEYP